MPTDADLVEVEPHHLILNPALPFSKALVDTTNFVSSPSRPGWKVPRLYDVSSITEQPKLFQKVIQFYVKRYRAMGANGPTHILAIENRGCFIGIPLAMLLGVPFIPMRRDKINLSDFVTEGDDRPPVPPISIRNNSISDTSRVVIIDDFISTGRTMGSAMDCAVIAGATIVEIATLCDLSASGGVEYIHSKQAYRNTNILTLFRLRNPMEVLFYKYPSSSSAHL